LKDIDPEFRNWSVNKFSNMFKITIKNIIRNFIKYINISLINLVGLVLAFTVFIFIGHYVLYENSFDKFWSGNEQIYRVSRLSTQNGEIVYDGVKSPRGIYFAKDEIPEAKACGYAYFESCQIRKKPNTLFEQNVLWVSYGFQEVFDFEMKEGVADFKKTHTGIISESKAKALFGDENPIGEIIKVNEGMPIEITGVFKDLPANTHLVADYFISSRTWIDYGWISARGGWGWNGWWTYFKLKKGADPVNLEKKLADLVKVHLPNLEKENRTTTFSLQPLNAIHYDNFKKGDYGKKANKTSLISLFLFGVFVLIIAWINYINLSTALAIKKEKAIGIQKILGAKTAQQIMHVLLDNLMFNILAVIFACILYWLISPFFANSFEIPIRESYLPRKILIGGIIIALSIGVIVSSAYSVLSILHINPIVHKTKIKEGLFQRGLIIAQLSITMMFISMSILIYRQINFIQNYNLGMNINQVLVLSAPTSYNGQVNPTRLENPKFDRFIDFRSSLLSNNLIYSATAVEDLPGTEMRDNSVQYTRPNSDVNISDRFSRMNIDNGFVETFDLELLGGKLLPDTKMRFGQLALINEEALKDLGFSTPQEAVGQIIQRGHRQIEICGVVKNFHYEGLHKTIYPIVMEFNHPTEFGYYPIKISSNNISSVMDYIEETWEKYYPDDPFNCFFQDDFYNLQYQSFKRIAKFNVLFALLSVFISCLGLYGILMFYIARNQKEIGIRKINGASAVNIIYLLNKNIILWFVIAFIIATPLAWYIMQEWLKNFAYRIDISWWIFALSCFLAITIALFTVSWQSWRAAVRNPVEALRHE
jgi:putative ABC transport system permease protein